MKYLMITSLIFVFCGCDLLKKNTVKQTEVAKVEKIKEYPLPNYTIETVPSTQQEFLAMYQNAGTSPEGTVAMVLLGMWIYCEDKELGEEILAAVSTSEKLKEGKLRNTELFRLKNMRGRYVVQSYFQGTSPENLYQTDLPFTVSCFTRQPNWEDEGNVKLSVLCNGADSPRTVTVVQEDGVWKAKEWAVLASGVKKN